MLKISVSQSNERSVTLQLAGRVIGRWVEEVQKACDRHLARGYHLTLDMSEVRFVDMEGAALVRSLIEQGVELVLCSKFVAKQLERAGKPA